MNSEPHCTNGRLAYCAPQRNLNHKPVCRSIRNLIAFSLSFLLLITPVLVIPAGVHAQSEGDGYAQLSASAQQIAQAINQVRANAGLGALTVHPLLNQAAQAHSDDILFNYNYSHWGTDGTLVDDRVVRTGYHSEPWVSENWVSSSSPSSAMNWWMNDYIHRVNILSGHWRQVGIGVSAREGGREMIFVTVFSATEQDGSFADGPVSVPQIQAAAPKPAPVVELPPGVDYTILPGDTLVTIASRYNLAWENVAAVNGLNESSILQIGQILRLPGVTEAEVAAQAHKKQPRAEQPKVLSGKAYTVKSGDTLFSIAGHAGMPWQEVAAHNGFSEDLLLQIGQVIYLPTAEEPAGETVQSPSVATAKLSPAPELTDDGQAATVAYNSGTGTGGDNGSVGAGAQVLQEHAAAVSLQWEVAEDERDVIVDTAAAEEPVVSAASITPGGGIAGVDDMPVAVETSNETSRGPEQPEPVGANVHTVRAGETVFGIAVQHEMDWQQLLALNGIDESSVLQPGQQLRLR